MLTVTDLFCGAGGSSTGAIAVPGVVVRMAANHWQLAVNSHNTNHQTTDHDCADLSQVDPARYPRTDVLWASPECTNHSQAKARRRQLDAQPDLFGETLPDEAAERSRATMWDVVRFADQHRYAAIVVENVVDVAKWLLWPSWLDALERLDYCAHVVYLNSMHARAGGLPAPQSRDRLYVVAHLRTTRCPDLDRWTRPPAWCQACGQTIAAMQAWKNPRKIWGRYRAQYVWRCPRVSCRNAIVEPGWLPALAALDPTLPAVRIGDRAKPLKPKTVWRIAEGLRRHYPPRELLVPTEGRPGKSAADATGPLRILTSRNETALLVPAGGTWNTTATSTAEVMRTRTTRDTEAVVTPPTTPTQPAPGIGVVPLVIPLRNHNTAKPVTDTFDTFAANGNHHGLLMAYYSNGTCAPTTDPHRTFNTRDRFALIMRNNTGGAEMSTPVTEPLRTLTTGGHQSLLEHDLGHDMPAVEDCLFRMLEPHEIGAGMAFPTGYVVLGSKRKKVRQYGNAVTPPAARDLIAAVAESLGHDLGDPTTWPQPDPATAWNAVGGSERSA